MRPQEPRTIDPHELIDPADEAKIKALAEQLEVTPADIVDAVDKVGAHPVALAIFLDRPTAV